MRRPLVARNARRFTRRHEDVFRTDALEEVLYRLLPGWIRLLLARSNQTAEATCCQPSPQGSARQGPTTGNEDVGVRIHQAHTLAWRRSRRWDVID